MMQREHGHRETDTARADRQRGGVALKDPDLRKARAMTAGERDRHGIAIHDQDADRATIAARPGDEVSREITASAPHVEHDEAAGARNARGFPRDGTHAETVAAEDREPLDVGERRREIGRGQRPVEIFERVLLSLHQKRRSAPSAAKPGPSAITSPHSPGTGFAVRSVSSRTNTMVADDMLP